MNIEIRKLTPDLAEDYARFFDTTPHWENGTDADKCYCVSWRNDDTYAGSDDHWYPTREERRERAIQFVKDNRLQGYLAYHGERIVGWCNATADCQKGVNYLRLYWPIAEYQADNKIKSIFCFVIAPDMKRKGVATQLLKRVCLDAADEGCGFVEAYPDNEPEMSHRGPLALFIKCGFQKYAERGGRVVVRKPCKIIGGTTQI